MAERVARLGALTALAMIAFAANSLLNRAALEAGGGAMAFAALRLASGAVILSLLATWRGGAGWLVRMRPGGVLALSVYMLGFSLAYRGIDAGAGALVLFAGVQITMFGGAVTGRERVPPRRWLGAGLATAGLAWMLLPGSSAVALVPFLLMSAAALGWGIYSLIGRGATDPLGQTAANFVGAVPVGLAGWLVGPGPGLAGSGIVLAVLSGALTSGLGYALWYAVLPRLGATRGALAQLTVPVIALAGGALFLGEAVTPRLLIAAALVVGGVALGMTERR